ncbi:MAG: MazG family protein [Chlamydiae bacterium]|nr:MazG family protein [Chlamydiota bacterium]
MKEFDDLVEVTSRLLGPGGCSWDQKQTFFSLQPYVLEEAHEVVEAVDGQKKEEIIEELGDLLYVILFYAKLAEKEGLFSLQDILIANKEKAIRRHPHVFDALDVKDDEEIVRNYERIKKEEAGKKQRKSSLDGIPDQLPSLAKAQKMQRIFAKKGFAPTTQETLATELWHLIWRAEQAGEDLESVFRRHLSSLRESFTLWEQENTGCVTTS